MARYHRSWSDQIRGCQPGECGRRLVVVGRVASHAHGFEVFAFVSSNTNPSSVMAAYNGIRFTPKAGCWIDAAVRHTWLLFISN
jgi:hypothetical protein